MMTMLIGRVALSLVLALTATQAGGSGGARYLIHRGGTQNYTGSFEVVPNKRLTELQDREPGSYVWVRRADGEWIVRDTDFVERALTLFRTPAPLQKEIDKHDRDERDLDAEETALDDKESRLDDREEEIESKEEAIDDDSSDRAVELARQEIDRRRSDLDRDRRALDERRRQVERKQRDLERIERSIDERVDEIERQAETALFRMLEEAIRSGAAQRF